METSLDLPQLLQLVNGWAGQLANGDPYERETAAVIEDMMTFVATCNGIIALNNHPAWSLRPAWMPANEVDEGELLITLRQWGTPALKQIVAACNKILAARPPMVPEET